MRIGMDIGFGDVKLAITADENQEPKLLSFPSVYAKYVPSPMNPDENGIIEYGDKQYLVGDKAKRERTQISPADFDDIVEASGVFCAYLHQQYGIDDTGIVVAGVPPVYWHRRNEYQKRLARFWEQVGIVPQGLGIAQTVVQELEPGTRHLVIDIGFNTVDHLLVEVEEPEENGGPPKVRTRRGGTWRNCGVTFLVELFRAEMGETGLKGLRFHVLKDFLRTGTANFHGEVIDLSGAKRRAADHYRATLSSRIKEEFGGDTDHIDGMIVASGGVHYFDPNQIFDTLPVRIPEKPEFANAIGQMMLA
ncbi:hypothetical protein SAMN02746041_01846 [Desulfacinum hydrothermale DSM 13146]|uniref:Uncharacterized protein n=1 Tax=Desulfacinum hydrothermale DSM 13146 TaxID=1121390 RepID=A0A1W1XIW6_9BACT|nr:ParM/StbA family protein [Desulfacinum hydrothermale]SMC23777.1 hypothetical protein SAMN02746041_01846 [Desulfacinum hydrothermale DSM 13146]